MDVIIVMDGKLLVMKQKQVKSKNNGRIIQLSATKWKENLIKRNKMEGEFN